MPSVNQNNQYGDNNVYIMRLTVDVGWIQNIIFNNPEQVTNLLEKIEEYEELENDNEDYDTSPMDDIEDKNKKNNLEEFYKEFIQQEESKFEVLEDFIKENDLGLKVERASKVIRRAIYSYNDRCSNKLTPQIFQELLTNFTENLNSHDEKNLMELWIYFLYRYCFIGEK